MYISDKIRTYLRNEFVERSISIADYELESIVDSALSGNFIFRIIYDDSLLNVGYSYKEHYVVDYDKFISSNDGDLVSIDGGIRFQWSKREVIVVDKSMIRDLKINKIL
jgi:hypothetical protein